MTDMKMPSGTRVLNNQGRSLHGPGPVVVEQKHMKFLITDRPTDATLPRYIEDLKRYDAHVVVRVCEPTYNIEQLKKQGIDVLDWAFDDGAAPPKEVVDGWLQLLKKKFKEKPGSCIAVHCVAGLGSTLAIIHAVTDVISLGLQTTVFPAAIAGAIL